MGITRMKEGGKRRGKRKKEKKRENKKIRRREVVTVDSEIVK